MMRQTVHVILALTLLFFNSGLAIYLCWDDVVAVASVAASALALMFLVASRLGCPEDNGGGSTTVSGGALLKAAICCLAILLMAYEVVRIASPVPPCVLMVGGAAVGTLSTYLLLRHYYESGSNKSHREALLPLVQEFLKDMHVRYPQLIR